MTQQEQQLLSGLIDRVNKTPINDKDTEAEQALRSGLSGNPDALYVLSQTVLVQQFALENAQRAGKQDQAAAQAETLKTSTQSQPPSVICDAIRPALPCWDVRPR